MGLKWDYHKKYKSGRVTNGQGNSKFIRKSLRNLPQQSDGNFLSHTDD
jgi:hypothetical protein